MSKGRFLAEFEIYLLLAIARADGEAYGAKIRRIIEERSGRPVSIGAVYATLGRLADKGLVAHRVSEPLPVPGGRSRKLYRLTAKGRRALAHSLEMFAKMMRGVELSPSGGRAE